MMALKSVQYEIVCRTEERPDRWIPTRRRLVAATRDVARETTNAGDDDGGE